MCVLPSILSFYTLNCYNKLRGVPGDGEQATVCLEGCAMSDVSMALAGLNLTIPDPYNANSMITANPGTLNNWLKANQGYICLDGDCNNLILWIIDNLTNNHLQVRNGTALTNPSLFDIRRGLDAQDAIYIAHNPSISHFVLFTQPSFGWLDETFYVHDPGFNATIYNFNETGGYLIYNIYGISRKYPYYAQCNGTWSDDYMGTNNKTICAVGCLMSSVSMAMAGYNIPIMNDNGENMVTTPGTLNWWLQQNNGYENGTSNLNENVLNKIPNDRVKWYDQNGMHTKNDISIDTLREYLQDYKRRIVIANVMEGQHFVLVYDINMSDKDTLLVNDPGQFHDTYSYKNDVVGWRIFDMA